MTSIEDIIGALLFLFIAGKVLKFVLRFMFHDGGYRPDR